VDTAWTRIPFCRRTRWRSPPSGRGSKRDWWRRSRRPPCSWIHLKSQDRLLIKQPLAAEDAIVPALSLLREVYFIQPQACLLSWRQGGGGGEERNREKYWILWLRLYGGLFLRGGEGGRRREMKQTLSACLSLRHVAFANFNEPEWLAAADSTFLRAPRRCRDRAASRCGISCGRT